MNRLPTATTYAWLAAGAAAFVVYGSFVPFDFYTRPLAEALAAWRWVMENRGGMASRSDWAANVLLGFPLGFCLLGALRCDRPGAAGALRAGAVVWPLCVLLAVAVEFGQLFFHGRTSSLGDVIAQGLGAACGVFAWATSGQWLTEYVRGAWDGPRVGGTAGRLLVIYLLALAFVQLLPLDLSASPHDWYHKWTAGGVTVVPFADASQKKWVDWLQLAGLYLPAGLLAAGRVGRAWETAPKIVVLGLAAALAIELAQWPVQSRTPSVSDALVGTAAVVAGWAIGRAVHTGRGLDLEGGLILGQAWMLLLLAIEWAPFDFHGGIGATRLRGVNWVPFAVAEQQHPMFALEQAAAKVLLAAPLGGVIAAVGAAGGRARIWFAALLAAALAAVVELGQLFLPARTPGPTDLVYYGLGAWLGAAAVTAVRTAAAQVVPLAAAPPSDFDLVLDYGFVLPPAPVPEPPDLGLEPFATLPPRPEATPPPAPGRSSSTLLEMPDLTRDDDQPIHVRLANHDAEDSTT